MHARQRSPSVGQGGGVQASARFCRASCESRIGPLTSTLDDPAPMPRG
jgi:hypothetical protein